MTAQKWPGSAVNSQPAGNRGNADLGEFLRTRRSRIDPRDAGIPDSARRRVPGLRREELARLAGVSPDYYTRLEQGRHPTASPGVLDALARALRLPAGERAHLYALAQAVDPDPPDDGAADGAEALERMLAAFGPVPAVLCGAFSDILAANDAARFLYGTDPRDLPAPERNSIHWMLTAPAARALYDECWEQTATEMIGALRTESGRRPRHPRARALVAQLDARSDLFRQVWRQHEVSSCVEGTKTLRHPAAGPLRMRTDAVTIRSAPGHAFYVMFPLDPTFQAAYQKHGHDLQAPPAPEPGQ
jgi:transcriptional regulator with XRE-family HTH domain